MPRPRLDVHHGFGWLFVLLRSLQVLTRKKHAKADKRLRQAERLRQAKAAQQYKERRRYAPPLP